MEFVRELLLHLTSPAALVAAVRTAIAVALVVAAAAAAIALSRRALDRALSPAPGVRDYEARLARARTLVSLLHSVVRYAVYFVALVMVLRQLNVDTTALLASAGIAGIAVGFGAQSLVRDSIAGFFLLLDGAIQVGDVISVAGETGRVEQITLRNTQIRRYTGELVTIPNGEITRFANLSRGFLRAVVVVTVPQDADLPRAAEILARCASAWAEDRAGWVVGSVEVAPLVEWSAAGASLRLAVPVRPPYRVDAEAELRQRVRDALAQAGVSVQALSPSVWPM
jgi:small-conductance mechanosensitive channel